MLSYIDNKLIKGAQWMVRQFELYTSLTRRDLYYFFQVYGSTMTGFTVLLAGTTNVFLLMGIYCSWLVSIKNENRRQTSSDILSSAILTRRFLRVVSFEATIFLFLIVTALLQCDPEMVAEMSWFRIGYGYWVLLSPMISITTLEYLLCTTSLPPGEKERRRQEKEMQNAFPAAI